MVASLSLPLLILLGILPSLAWLIFFLQEDREHPEPKRAVFFVFIGGAAITFFVAVAQLVAVAKLPNLNIENLPVSAIPLEVSAASLVSMAFIEEVAKFLIVFLLISRARFFDEPLDAMVYMITAALGFAAIENVLNIADASDPVGTITLRFIGSTLLHALSSAVVGYYWAKGIIKKNSGYIVPGLIFATLLHALFNYLILSFDQAIYATLFLVFIAFFIFADFEKIKHEEEKYELA